MFRTLVCVLTGFLMVAGVALSADGVKQKKKGKFAVGTVESYKDGVLTVKVREKKGDEPKTKEFKIGDETKVVVFHGDDKKELVGKEGFKDVKEGTRVIIILGDDDQVKGVRINPPKRKK